VTTIPAAACLGVSLGLGEAAKAPGAAAVLGLNVLMMIVGAAATLACQRALDRKRPRIDCPR